jgi:hypothetical protein
MEGNPISWLTKFGWEKTARLAHHKHPNNKKPWFVPLPHLLLVSINPLFSKLIGY